MKITGLELLPTPTGAETFPVVSGGKTKRTTIAALMASVGQPYVDAAHLSADRAAAFALILEATTAGGWFESLAAGAAAVAEGEGFFVNDGTSFYTGKRVGGVGVQMASFVTEKPYDIDVRGRLFGAKGDAWQFADGVIAAGALDRISFTNFGWKPSAVNTGNPICIMGAGVARAPLVTTIAGFIAPDTLLLSTPASGAVAEAKGEFGTNDRAAIQAAIDAAHAIGGANIHYGGPGWKYLLAGDPAIYGTFTEPDGSKSPFPRGMLELRSNVSHHGDGATVLLSGGRKNAPGLYYNDFWSTNDPIQNVRFTGLTLDGNLAHQVMTVYAANAGNTNGAGVWQHGNAISLAYGLNIEVDHCILRNTRGDGMRFFDNDNGDISRNIRVSDCELYNIFTQGVAGIGIGLWVERCHFHGDGFWVAAIDFESLSSNSHLLDAYVLDNIFDFSDGLSPVERTPQYASDSAEAWAARRHLRRAVSFAQWVDGFPGNIYNDKVGRCTFSGNKCYQAVVDLARFADITISGNQVTNFFEDVTGHYGLIASVVSFYSDNVAGLGRLIIADNIIKSDLAASCINIYNNELTHVTDNIIVGTRGAGVTFNNSSGAITGNTIVDVGRTVTSGDLPLQHQTGVYTVGRKAGPLTVARNICHDTRAGDARRMQCAVYSNTDGADIRDNTGQGMITATVIENVAGHSRLIGNRDAANLADPWKSSAPIAAPSGSFTGGVTAGGTVAAVGAITSGDAIKAAGDLVGKGLQIAAAAAGDVVNQTWLSPRDGGGYSVHYQWSINTSNNAMTLNRFNPADGTVLGSVLLVHPDGTLLLSDTGLRIRPGALPVYADNAAAIAGGLAVATLYRTATGQVQIVY